MKFFKYLCIGVIFGIALSKGRIISWYTIQEMFHFQSFHMYGVIGSAVFIGMAAIYVIKRFEVKDISGQPIVIPAKKKTVTRYLIGGTIFGLGWALSGACPGPLFIILGHGASVILVPIAAAILGAFLYGLVRDRLPH